MKAITRLIVHLVELAEAEGRAVKRAIFRLVLALVLVIIVGGLLLAALAMLGGALYLTLADVTSPAGALAILGGIAALLAIIGLLSAVVLRDKGSGSRR